MLQIPTRPNTGTFEPALFANRPKSETAKRVSKYFETSGFSRWSAIYGSGDIPPIRRSSATDTSGPSTR